MQILPRLTHYLEKSNNNLSKALELLKQDGFNTVSILIENNIEWLRKNWVDAGLVPVIHSDYVDTNLASSNEGIRKESVRQLKEEILLAKDIGCKIINFHPGKYKNIFHEEDAYKALFESLEEVIPFAAENGITLSLEYIEKEGKNICASLEKVKFVLEKFPLLAFTLDAAHAAINGEDPIRIYDELKKKIKIIHISGVLLGRSHVEVSLLETGYHFADFIRKIKDFDGYVEIENREYSKFKDSLGFIKEVLGQPKI